MSLSPVPSHSISQSGGNDPGHGNPSFTLPENINNSKVEYTNTQQEITDGDIIHRTTRHDRLCG
jgi:hypothetical protein